jgi:hypothetical protein
MGQYRRNCALYCLRYATICHARDFLHSADAVGFAELSVPKGRFDWVVANVATLPWFRSERHVHASAGAGVEKAQRCHFSRRLISEVGRVVQRRPRLKRSDRRSTCKHVIWWLNDIRPLARALHSPWLVDHSTDELAVKVATAACRRVCGHVHSGPPPDIFDPFLLGAWFAGSAPMDPRGPKIVIRSDVPCIGKCREDLRSRVGQS